MNHPSTNAPRRVAQRRFARAGSPAGLAAVVMALVLFGALPGSVAVHAQDDRPTLTLTVTEIASRAQNRNLALLKASLAVDRTQADLTGEPRLLDTTSSVTAGYRERTSGWYTGATVSVPVLPQVSIGGGVTWSEVQERGEELSVAVRPFATGRETWYEEQSYGAAVVRRDYLLRSTFLGAEKAAIALLIRDMERKLSRQTLELKQKTYDLSVRRQAAGEVSFQDVQDRQADLISARQALFTTERTRLGDWNTLQLLFAPSEQQIDVVPLTLEELLAMVDERAEAVSRHRDSEPVTEKLEILRLELAALEAELESIDGWKPDLSVSASLAFPGTTPGTALTFSFSPSETRQTDSEDLRQDIEIRKMEIATELFTAELQKALGTQSIAISEEALSSARLQVEWDTTTLREAELLFRQGTRTSLDLEQLRLNVRRDEIRTFQAAADLYEVMGTYLMLFVGE